MASYNGTRMIAKAETAEKFVVLFFASANSIAHEFIHARPFLCQLMATKVKGNLVKNKGITKKLNLGLQLKHIFANIVVN